MRFIRHSRWPSHCAAICGHKNGSLVSYYEGEECTDDQRVRIEFWKDDEELASCYLPYKTGNSILLKTSNDEAWIIFSIFKDEDEKGNKPTYPVDRWMMCLNYQARVRFIDNQIVVDDTSLLDWPIGYLVRCAPIRVSGEWFLPIYREHDCHGIVMRSKNGITWEEQGRIGDTMREASGRFGNGVLIQPTLWHDGDKICSLSRDVTYRKRAWYSESSDKGRTWTTPRPTQISNANNSIVAINDGTKTPMLVWNHGIDRRVLVIGRWDGENLIARPNQILVSELSPLASRSYPNYAFIGGECHVVFTENKRIIRAIF